MRDSISELTLLLKKLPHRKDHENVQYSIDKHMDRFNNLAFNWFHIQNLDYLADEDNLREFRITGKDKESWIKYVSSDLTPFDTLNAHEAERFIDLIKFLSENSLTSLEASPRGISLAYCDSLRLAVKTGFRQIRLDTSNYYDPEYYYIYDIKDGFYLMSK
ncbi:hypothetical protein [Reichenbachiella sp.]|uniref:hypothetical protein n=1 Tax=Reichenbachiella sp. TaxID=2184521 RepID=UPI003B5BCBBF